MADRLATASPREEPMRKQLMLGAMWSLIVASGCAEPPSPEAPATPEALIGTWKVDLRPTPDAEPYYQEFVVESVEGDTIRGTFYGTAIEHGRINSDWGTVQFAFTTADGSGPYNTSGILRGTRLEGTTHSLGREFLAVWSAERAK